jgi:hypothetical protein
MNTNMRHCIDRPVIYQNCAGREFPALLLGGTTLGAHLLVNVDGTPVILRRVPWFGDSVAGGEHWRYVALHDALESVPVVRRTCEMPVVADDESCAVHEWRDEEDLG